MQIKKPSNRILAPLVLILLIIGGLFTFWQIQRSQEFRQRASTVTWFTTQSVTPACGISGTVLLTVSFTNAESTRSMLVTAKDTTSGVSVDLGTVDAGKTKTGQIDTKQVSAVAGAVIFNLAWSDTPSQVDTKTASYSSVAACSKQPVCTATSLSQAACTWDQMPGATAYNVIITDTTTGTVIDTEKVASSSSQVLFTSKPGESYKCSVSAQNTCGTGDANESPESTCPVPPTPTPTPAVCIPTDSTCTWDTLPGATQYDVTVINADSGETIKTGTVIAPDTSFHFPSQPGVSYQCKVTSKNVCGNGSPSQGTPSVCGMTPTPTIPGTPTGTPSPTDTPIPTPTLSPTPLPTATPYPTLTPVPTQTPYPTFTPAPTPTPIVIVRILPTPQPQIIQLPGQTQIVQVPGPREIVQVPVQQQTIVQVTGTPHIAPTGNVGTTVTILGVSGLFVALGGLLFFIL